MAAASAAFSNAIPSPRNCWHQARRSGATGSPTGRAGRSCCATAATSSARHFLPGICRGEIFFAIGMSEPDSGSDLASIRTRAIPVCGGYEVTGAKVWTSYAHESHYAITLVRTDTIDPKNRHAGLTQLIVDLKAPGVTIRPIRNLAGEHDFNEIVLDRVFVPSERLVGGEGDGWRQVTSELAFERSGPERFLSSNAGAGRAGRARRRRSRAGAGRSARPHRRESVDAAADVAVGRRHAAGGRNPEPRSRAGQGSGRRLRARRPGAGARVDPAARRQGRWATGSRRRSPRRFCTRRPGPCAAARAKYCAASSPAASGCAEEGERAIRRCAIRSCTTARCACSATT